MSTAKTLDSSQFCDIGATPAGGGMVKLDVLIHADKAVSGSYTFRVEKTGGGGSSTINHGGDFDAKAGQTVSCTKKTGGN